MTPCRFYPGFLLILSCGFLSDLATTRSNAQVVAPPAPTEYRAVIRYRIRAAANQRLPLFFSLTKYLKDIGFQKNPGTENEAADPDQVRMTGTIPAQAVGKILENSLVKAVLLSPVGFELPANDQSVKVQLELAAGLRGNAQTQLAAQVVQRLEAIGFHESKGYDTRDSRRIVGRIPARNVALLLEDLRWQDSGWLAPFTPVNDLPYPIRNYWPIRIVEILPDPAGVTSVGAPPAPIPTVDNRGVALEVLGLEDKVKPRLLEIKFATPPAFEEAGWWHTFQDTAPGMNVEGRFGATLTVRAPAALAPALAQLPGVLTVRLPRPGTSAIAGGLEPSQSPAEALRVLGFGTLRPQSNARSVRLAIIGTDFRGFEGLIGSGLPARTQFIDMTAECNPNIEPAPFASENSGLGDGARAALAAAAAAPGCELVLVRIAPDLPSQLLAVARYIHGDLVVSDCLIHRGEELAEEDLRLRDVRTRLLEERREVLDDFRENQATLDRRETLSKKEADFQKQVEQLRQRERRYLQLIKDLQGLKGVNVVANTLIWYDGYAVDGGNPLTRYLDQRPCPRAIWFQAAGDARGQTWSGPFKDANENGVMEFAPLSAPLNPGRWTSELNFLGSRAMSGEPSQDLPAGRIRITLQWREPHDPAFESEKIASYRQPLANLRLVLLRQRDPSGTKLPTDDLEIVAQSGGLPARLAEERDSAVYEQVLEYTVPAPGRYALRLEGRIPDRIRPNNAPELPVLRRGWALHPRLFLSGMGTILSGMGLEGFRPVFLDYPSEVGSPGMPADAQSVLSVATIDSAGRREVASSGGPTLGQTLHLKPDLLMFNRLQLGSRGGTASGSGMAAGLAAGAAARALAAGVPPEAFLPGPDGTPPARLRIRSGP
jgi:hypothetical protein